MGVGSEMHTLIKPLGAELEAAPLLKEMEGSTVAPSSYQGESSTAFSPRSDFGISSGVQSPTLEHQFPSYPYGPENNDNPSSWMTINTQYGPVPVPLHSCVWSPQFDAVKSDSSNYSSNPPAYNLPHAEMITSVPPTVEAVKKRFNKQPDLKISIPEENLQLESILGGSQLPIDRFSSCATINREQYLVAAPPPSTVDSPEVEIGSSSPSTPLLSPSDEIKIFTVVPLAQCAQTQNYGQSSAQGGQAGGGGDGLNNNSESNEESQNDKIQASGRRPDGDGNDNYEDDNGRRRKRKRFPPGDDPSSHHWSNERKYACVYHKYDPQQYGVCNRRYLVCEGTGFKYISELMYVFSLFFFES